MATPSARSRFRWNLCAWLFAAVGCEIPPAPCGLRVCDIRQDTCQQIAAEGAACLRELPPVVVPIHVVSRAEYLASQEATPLTPEAEHAFSTWNAGLALWGLAPAGLSSADAVRASAEQLGAFYSNGDKTITIVDSGEGVLESRAAVALLVHEYTHALQDAGFGLDAFSTRFDSDFDRTQAAQSIIEGEATVVQDLANVGLFGDVPGAIPWDGVFDHWRSEARKSALQSTMPVNLEWAHFQYPFGTPFVHSAYAGGGWAAVDALHDAPPTGSREVMAGFGAIENTGGPWAEDLGSDAVAVLPERFAYFDSDSVGAWIFDVFMTHANPNYDRAMSNLRGDALSIYEDQSTGTVAAVWRLRFSSSIEATAVASTLAAGTMLTAAPAGFAQVQQLVRVQQIDRDLVLVTTGAADGLSAIPESLTFAAAPAKTAAAKAAAAGAAAMNLSCAKQLR